MFRGFLGGLDPIQIFASLVVLFVSLPVHSFIKAYTANKLGDPTPDQMGRLTLNPFAHINPWGAIALVLFRFGWSKPLPIDSRNLENPKRDLGLISGAGILSYLGMGLVFTVPTLFAYRAALGSMSAANISANHPSLIFYELFLTIVVINVQLAVLNLLPIIPFDGGTILAALLPDKAAAAFYRFFQKNQGIITVTLLVLFYSGLLSRPLSWLSGKIVNLFMDILRPLIL